MNRRQLLLGAVGAVVAVPAVKAATERYSMPVDLWQNADDVTIEVRSAQSISKADLMKVQPRKLITHAELREIAGRVLEQEFSRVYG
jgi:hypothetical protein